MNKIMSFIIIIILIQNIYSNEININKIDTKLFINGFKSNPLIKKEIKELTIKLKLKKDINKNLIHLKRKLPRERYEKLLQITTL